MNKTDILVRLATFADYEAVLDINRNVYDGFDYLPVMYHEILHNPHNVAMVAEMKGKVVGYIHFMLVIILTEYCKNNLLALVSIGAYSFEV